MPLPCNPSPHPRPTSTLITTPPLSTRVALSCRSGLSTGLAHLVSPPPVPMTTPPSLLLPHLPLLLPNLSSPTRAPLWTTVCTPFGTACTLRHLPRKRKCKLVRAVSDQLPHIGFQVEEGKRGAVQEPTVARASTWAAAAVASSTLDSRASSFCTSEERLSVKNDRINVNEEVYQGDPSKVSEFDRGQEALEVYDRYIGVQPVRGRFEVKLQKDRHFNTLIFSLKSEAAKAYDKAAYKLHGGDAKTNFGLTEEEKLDVKRMEWEELLLQMQLQDLAQASPSRLGFPGVCYKEEEQSWMVKIRHEKRNYVGYFSSMTEATKTYDLAAYKLRGRDALLSRPLSSTEKMELMHKDWDSLTARLGLKVQAPRQRRSTEGRGVRLRPSGNWLASFSHKSYYFYLGTFDSKDAAAKAYDLFASKLLGDNAKVNSELLPEEKDFLSTISSFNLRNHLALQAIIAPKMTHLGARGARLVQGQWQVVLENSRKDRIYTSSVSNEQEALKVHDMVVYKLHNGMGRTYGELTISEQQDVDSADWSSVASKFDLQQMPSYRGVNRLISGVWQSYIRHGGAYLAIATFDSADAAAHSSDKCEYKLRGKNAILNFPLLERQKRDVEALDWGALIASIRAEQKRSAVLTKLGGTLALSSLDTSRDKKWMLLLCHEQLLQQQMTRRAPKVGRQLVVANPALAAQFSDFNRRADESPMLVEEVMEGSNTPILWECTCGKIILKTPMGLLKARQVVCKMAGCTARPPTPRRMHYKEKSLGDSNGAAKKSPRKQAVYQL